ncbi:MAG: PKD domain-containing protein [Flavobacteriales bacterium]|nr:PKD domain-containing protein [Flavobacteriales bacterium]
MMKPLSFLACALVINLSAVAQQDPRPCGSDELDRLVRFHHNDPEALEGIAQAHADLEAFTNQWMEENTGAERVDVTIPVVFHIIHNNGQENISDEQVYDAIRVLNDDYNRLNADWDNVRPEFLGIVADVGITFALARKDPSGNCTKGITRTLSTLTYDGTQTMKDLIQWPRNKYLNVWVAASADGAAGYTYRPGAVTNWAEADGIVLLHNYTGSIGTSSVSHSRTLTHEVGHWINLKHCWGDSNDPGLDENCNQDDNVSDTPNTKGWTSCFLAGASCSSTIDNVENYMEYSYCSKMFTEGQKTRMLAALNSGTSQRNQLWTANNLTATGVNNAPVLCAAEFSSDATLICAGSTVTFTDESFHGVTSRNWSFAGGEPATSSEEQPTITYTQPGTYSVQLTVSDGSTTLSTTQNLAITVLANPGDQVPMSEGFESLSALNGPEWYTVNGGGGNTWGVTTSAAYTGSKSARILNSTAMIGKVDELLSRSYDMSGATAITVSFRHAFARRSSANDDALSIYVSNDCGNVWSLRKILRATTTLVTGGTVTGSFVPTSSQWGYTELTNIGPANHVSDFRFKFVFESDGGNNLYLDDININGMPVGVEELAASASGLSLLPNPTTGATQLAFELDRAAHVRVEVLDALGRTVQRSDLGLRPAGGQRAERWMPQPSPQAPTWCAL